MAAPVLKMRTNQEVTRFNKCAMKNLLAEETRLEMSGSQEHLRSCYPKCMEAGSVTEYIRKNCTIPNIVQESSECVQRAF